MSYLLTDEALLVKDSGWLNIALEIHLNINCHVVNDLHIRILHLDLCCAKIY